MASTALEEKINKIRLRNEEIKRRYEEVEADKKNAAKLDALVKPAPVEDWPERKEPPEFSASAPKQTNKPRHSVKKHSDQTTQYYSGSGEGKKAHNFADGQGPPPDPKYNFLADSERDEHGDESPRDSEKNRGRSKPTRGSFKRRGSGRDWHAKEQWNQQSSPGDASRPDYDAWRAERNRIDEARISRQRTAEGNWRREWDNDKMHMSDEVTRRDNRVTLGDLVTRQEHNENEKLYRPPRTTPRNVQHQNTRDPYHGSSIPEAGKAHAPVNDSEKRVVIATDKSIKVMLNPGSTPPKSSVRSVKVSPPNIAGTGRVGPRQRPRVMYSSQSDADVPTQESPTFARQKSLDEKMKGRYFDQPQKAVAPKNSQPQRKRDGDPKSPYLQRKDSDSSDKTEGMSKSNKKDSQKSPRPQRRGNGQGNYPPKSPRGNRRALDGAKPRSQEKSNSSSVSVDPKREANENGVSVSTEASAGSRQDESSKSLNYNDCTDEKNESSAMQTISPVDEIVEKVETDETIEEKSSLEPSDDSEVPQLDEVTEDISKVNDITLDEAPVDTLSRPSEAELQSADKVSVMLELNSSDISNKATERSENLASSSQPPIEPVAGPSNATQSSVENKEADGVKEALSEPSGSQDPKNSSVENAEAGPASSDTAIIRSSNSELTSDDSGFLELSNNTSVHEISVQETEETSDFAETSIDSVQSEHMVIEIQPVVENAVVEANETDLTVANGVEGRTDSSEKTEDINQRSIGEMDVDKATGISKELEKNLEPLAVNDTTESFNQSEKDSSTSPNASKENGDNKEITENAMVEVQTDKLQSEEKCEAESIGNPLKEAGSILDGSKVESTDLEIEKPAATMASDNQELENISICIEQSTASEDVHDKLEDESVSESARISKDPNDVEKENSVDTAILEAPSSPVVEKSESADKQID